MTISKEIGNRLREIAEQNGGPSAFARLLEMTPQQLNNYLSGRRIPGNKMQARLRKLEIDTTWLIIGIHPDPERQRKEIEKEIEGRKIITYLDSKGLDTLEKVKDVYELYEPMLKVAEKMEEYKTEKGKRK